MKLWTTTRKLRGGHEWWTWRKGKEIYWQALYIPGILIDTTNAPTLDIETDGASGVRYTRYLPAAERWPQWIKSDGQSITFGNDFTI